MKKEEKSPPRSSKVRSFYKYQLQATNQILKDTLDLEGSYLHSTAQTNRITNGQNNQFDEFFTQDNPDFKSFNHYYQAKLPQYRKIDDSINRFQRKYPQLQFQQDCESFKQNRLKQSFSHSKSQRVRKNHIEDKFESHSQQICSQSSNNEHDQYKKPSCYIDKSIQVVYKKEADVQENRKQMRRQRQGLANISLKVKNIVAKTGKMAFPQVSSAVLDDSKQDLPTEPKEREKQTKNIKRRVYDALNVLVAVDILGKEKRHVTCTGLTRLPGKKLSSHWQIITEKQRVLEEYKDNYIKKLHNLQLLKKKYEQVLNLHIRNRQTINKEKAEPTVNKGSTKKTHRFYFPLIFLIPHKHNPAKMKIQIVPDEKHPQSIRKFIVEGNQYVQTDLDMLKHITALSKLKLPIQHPITGTSEKDLSSLLIGDIYLQN